jgi:hypothetical protein
MAITASRVQINPAAIRLLRGHPEVLLGCVELAQTVADDASANAPIRTGLLAGSIKVVRQGVDVVVGTPGAPHAVLVELGTARMPAEPFLVPAAMSAPGRFTGAGDSGADGSGDGGGDG